MLGGMWVTQRKKLDNIGSGWLYFYVHFVTELICFYVLAIAVGDTAFLWTFVLVYDALAFVPQSIYGYISDKYSKIPMGVIGVLLMAIGALTFCYSPLPGKFTSLAVLCIGNGLVHINGAEVTLRCCEGKLSHSAIFVGGGSFGVITGKLLGQFGFPPFLPIVAVLSAIPFIILAENYRKKADQKKMSCGAFNYHNPKVPAAVVILLAVFVVIVRGYMGYGIPTSWRKTIIQTVALYVAMGVGKCLGGVLADKIGVKKIAIASSLLALPFLFAGDNNMYVSLIGVLFFSMTMSITLALLVSVLPNSPGLAFGLTTIGLFLGTAPIFFFKFTSAVSNCIVIGVLTLLCTVIMFTIIRKDERKNAE